MYIGTMMPSRFVVVLAAALLSSASIQSASGTDQIQNGSFAPDENQNTCGTRLTPDLARVAAFLQSRGIYDPPESSPRFVIQVPVTLHAVHQSDGTGGLSDSDAQDALVAANTLWEPAGIQFFMQQPVRRINNSTLFNIANEAELIQLWTTDVIQDSVNVYFVNVLSSFGGGNNCGVASFSFAPIQGVTVANGCTPQNGNVTTFAHELGHYFDLYHTHETAVGIECPDGSNCTNAGDLVCDTPADPNLSGQVDGACNYTGSATACGDPYNPNTGNVMSYAGVCRDHFTFEQGERAAATLNNVRTNLVIAGGNPSVTWVEFGAPGGGNGSYANPYNSVAAGVANVAPGGRVVFKPGATNETIQITDAVTLDSFQGVARIGG